MRWSSLHPFAALSVLSAVAAVVFPFVGLGVSLSAVSLLAVGLLASPFLVLVLGHYRAPKSLRKNAMLAFANVPLWCAWLLMAAAMWYLQAGWYGVAVFAPMLASLASIFLFLCRFVPEPRTHEA
jgi:hypothetical protein